MNIEEILHNELTEDQYNTVIDNHPEVLCLAFSVKVNAIILSGVTPS